MRPAVLAGQNDTKAKALSSLGWQIRPKRAAKTKSSIQPTAAGEVQKSGLGVGETVELDLCIVP